MGQRFAAPGLMVFSGLSLYAGAAIAVGLFDVLPPVVVAWFRIAAAGILLIALRRPALEAFFGHAGAMATMFGFVTLAMNMAFYQAIAYLPLGTAVAIEFLGPIAVAAWGSRNSQDWFALLLASSGVLFMSGAQWSASSYGVMFALLTAVLWATYILFGAQVAKTNSTNSLAIGFFWAGIITLPFIFVLWPTSGVAMPLWQIAGLAAGLGLLSAVIPYSLDQIILRMTGPAYFAMLLALLPLTAALLGAVVLGQTLTGAEIFGILAVVAAVVLRSR
ncbi:EamA family transporter [Corynebacterium freiburgense]|uniref:EamA family transporter n=1 Tax=Corynebacterium freiburgense TaxID=556548 RepID=UPI000420643B|nr:EamA family transporter [Corynebacterium freiburgense]WJZ03144.1 Threonine/homoserine exporter RhtA [Corynebacterium freiburgense]